MSRAAESVPHPARAAAEAVWRMESARLVGTLARFTGDFDLAEDLAQEALAEALVTWPRTGVPQEPAGWLLTVGRRRAVDWFRRASTLQSKYADLARRGSSPVPADEPLWDPDRIDDDVLALMFTAVHPALSRESSVALTLRVIGGLTSDEIARGLLVPTATVQARITRAKRTLASLGVPFEVPDVETRRGRLSAVLSVIYLIFTEGSTATSGPEMIRVDLAHEAIRLGRVLSRLVPESAEVHGLLALMELTAARFPARTDEAGRPILLEDQDRRRWDFSAIRRGRAALNRAENVGSGLGPYGVQAAIARCHGEAPSIEQTDWRRIVALYDALTELAPSPVVALNRAVAVAMADGPEAGLLITDELVEEGALVRNHLLASVRGELLLRAGRAAEARVEFEKAVAACASDVERARLIQKVESLS